MTVPLRSRSLSRCRATGAFTLVEVMFAALVMIMAITGSITTLQRGFNAIDSSRNYVIAAQIMQSEIERIRVCPWTSTATVTGIADYTDSSPAVAIDAAFTANPYVGSRFTLTRTVTDIATNLRQFTVTVSWRNYDGRPLSCSMTTYYARYGLYDFFVS